MKMLRNKKALQKMIITLIMLILFNFIFPVYSRAGWWGGGSLFDPIRDLICGIGDSLINYMQYTLLPGSPAAIDKISPAKLMEQMYRAAGDTASADNLATSLDQRGWGFGLVGWLADTFGGQETQDFYEERIIPVIIYSPAAIFSNLIPALDVNFINPTVSFTGGTVKYTPIRDSGNGTWQITAHYEEDTTMSEEEKMKSNTAYQLQGTISTWYKALRNIAIVGLLSVLVYVAIRIILSSTAGETAKYKTMLKDWVVAMCILLFMHYMMAFLLKTTEMLTDLFSSGDIMASREDASIRVERLKVDTFMSTTREMAQTDTSQLEVLGLPVGETAFAYTLMYVILIFYTIIFTWKYLKRFVYLAFLTMISPLVALTYPIDKIKDGSAQAFNKWFKEYTFNVLIQPIHLLLYTILISSAKSFATTNLIYSVVALGFMLEAEKIIKDFFGIQTQRGEAAGALTGGAAFGAAAGLMQKGLGLLPGGSSGGSSGGSGKSDSGKPRFNDRDSDSDASKPLDAFLGDNDNDGLNDTGIGGILPGGSSGGDSSLQTDSDSSVPTDPASKYKTKFARALSGLAGTATGKLKSGAGAVKTKVGSGVSAVKTKVGKGVGAVKTGASDIAGKIGKTRTIRGIKRFGQSAGKKLGGMGRSAANFGSDIMASPIGKGLRFTGKGLAGAGILAGKAGWGALKVGGKTLRGAGTVAGRFVGRNGIKMAKFAGRTALKGVGAATLGTIGLAAGLSSGDDSAILRYGSLGLTAGAAAGGQVANSAESLYGTLKSGEEQIQDDFQQGYYGNDYEEKALNPRLDREWKQDKDVQAYYKKKYGSEYRQRMKESLDIRKAGITDQDDIDTALKLVKKGATTDQAANIMQFTKGVTRADMLSSQKWENMQKLATQMVGENNPETVKKIMQLVNQRFKLDADWNPSAQRNNQGNSNGNNQNH